MEDVSGIEQQTPHPSGVCWTPDAALLAVLDLAASLERAATETTDEGESEGLSYAAERIRQVVAAGRYPDED